MYEATTRVYVHNFAVFLPRCFRVYRKETLTRLSNI